jgi:HSP20 family protein
MQQWDPFRELFEGMLGGLPGDGRTWTPRVDLEETDDAWIVEAEVPGAKRKDVDVEVGDGEVVISGEVKERERKGILRHRTRRIGKFEYRVIVPADAQTEGVDASLDEGILTVRIPKPERAKPRHIEIKEARQA